MTRKTALAHREPISDLFHRHCALVEYRAAVQMGSNPCHPPLVVGLVWPFLLSGKTEAWRAFQVESVEVFALSLR